MLARNREWHAAHKRTRTPEQMAKRAEGLRMRRAASETLRAQARERQRRQNAEHPEMAVTAAARYRARKRGASGHHTTAEWTALCWSSGWRCLYCAERLTEKTVVRDHRLPLSRGGSNAITNIAVSCGSCNSRKWALTEEEFHSRMRKGYANQS